MIKIRPSVNRETRIANGNVPPIAHAGGAEFMAGIECWDFEKLWVYFGKPLEMWGSLWCVRQRALGPHIGWAQLSTSCSKLASTCTSPRRSPIMGAARALCCIRELKYRWAGWIEIEVSG